MRESQNLGTNAAYQGSNATSFFLSYQQYRRARIKTDGSSDSTEGLTLSHQVSSPNF